MKKTIYFPILIAGFLTACFCGLAGFAEAKRGISVVPILDKQGKQVGLYKESYALIIGISDYTAGWPSLPGVVGDVQAVKQALEAQKFHVEVVMNPDRTRLRDAFEVFIDNYGQKAENRLLFYYAGHGHTLKLSTGKQMGYLVPANAPNPNMNQRGFLRKAMSMQQIEVFAKTMQAKHALFLFDSCFSGSIFSLSRAVPENISYKTSKPVRQFITSGSENETVPDKSIFRRQFIKALKGSGDSDGDGYVTGVELGEFLTNKVINYSKGTQHPKYGKIQDPDLDEGDFVFMLNLSEEQMAAVDPQQFKEVEKPEEEEVFSSDEVQSLPSNTKTSTAQLAEWNEKGNQFRIAKNYSEAFTWYRKAAKEGSTWSQYNLGAMYLNGWGVVKDYATALQWYRQSAEQGNAVAQNQIGWIYQNGLGVETDYVEAHKWYLQSAEKGNADAQNQLGYMYLKGLGVSPDKEKAHQWFLKSAAQGNKSAKSWLPEFEGTQKLSSGKLFLVSNSKKKGVVTLPSGLQYKIMKKGEGRRPRETDTVEVHYRGTLIDGTEFDSSYKRGRPASFPLKSVIMGWTEALQLMHEGGKWELFIPPDLAYGSRSMGQLIGPNETLVFVVELLRVKK